MSGMFRQRNDGHQRGNWSEVVCTRLKWVREIDGGPASTTLSQMLMAALQNPKSLPEQLG